MIFIDGEYLRKSIKNIFGRDKIDFNVLTHNLLKITNIGIVQGELIRVFYYSAMVDRNDERFEELDKYFNEIKKYNFYEVKLGRLVKTNRVYRQKGVDVLLAIDMITKAYENHYDIAILIGGDDDFTDVVKVVKDTGKRVYGAYFLNTISKRLVDIFDVRYEFKEDNVNFLL
jgi:uncharacterized LabA/DUF88 family protein